MVTAIFNSQQSTRRLLAERGETPADTSTASQHIQEQVNARRTTTTSTSITIPPTLPPTPPQTMLQQSPPVYGEIPSESSNSSYNSSNIGIEPYVPCLPLNSISSSSTQPMSISHPAKSNKHVTFSDHEENFVTPSICQEKLQLKSLPSYPS